MTTRVRIRRKDGQVVQGCDVYIGRRCNQGGWGLPASIFANPYFVGKDGTREEVIAKYYNHAINSADIMALLPQLDGKVLGCWCEPNESCHGDVLIYLINQLKTTYS
jgi:hypothetical protein